MAGINSVLDTGLKALMAQQIGIGVVGHNIANVNTEGYSRQTVDFVTADPITSLTLLVGSGVDVAKIKRVYDRFLEDQLVKKNQDVGRWNAIEAGLRKVEMIFNEAGGYSINQSMNDFWNAWHDLASNPSGLPERATLIAKADNLTSAFNQAVLSLKEVQKDMDFSIAVAVNEINLFVDQVAGLNSLISQVEIGGIEASDFRDQRDLILKKLSELLNLSYLEDEIGRLNIYLGNGKALVLGNTAWHLTTESNPESQGLLDIKWVDDQGNRETVNSVIKKGKVGGSLEVRNSYVPSYLEKINELGGMILKQVNQIHSTGVGLKGFQQIAADNAVNSDTSPLSESIDTAVQITPGSFDISVLDSANRVISSYTISYDPNLDSLEAIRDLINGQIPQGEAEAAIQRNRLILTGKANNTLVVSGDSGGLLAALGINTFFSGHDASDIKVNPVVKTDYNKIAASDAPNSPGNNLLALRIADLSSALTMNNGQESFGSYYSTMVGVMGAEVQRASRSSEYEQALLNQIALRRDSGTSVSIDEEVTNLIKYQNAYAAAARLISTVDELLQTVIAMVQ